VKLLLRRGVHLAIGALVPGTAIGDRQDERLTFARRAKDRVDITNWEILIHWVIVSELRHGAIFLNVDCWHRLNIDDQLFIVPVES
jgi:hypothetical protein